MSLQGSSIPQILSEIGAPLLAAASPIGRPLRVRREQKADRRRGHDRRPGAALSGGSVLPALLSTYSPLLLYGRLAAIGARSDRLNHPYERG